jgi:hypothetical protein
VKGVVGTAHVGSYSISLVGASLAFVCLALSRRKSPTAALVWPRLFSFIADGHLERRMGALACAYFWRWFAGQWLWPLTLHLARERRAPRRCRWLGRLLGR